jgi:ferredoxin, 2Fe-2S
MHLIVTDREGHVSTLEALEGWRVMEVIRDWGLPIKAECGGACSCATCHVYVDPAWVDRLPAPTDEELSQLDTTFAVEANSRLACQILVTSEMDGMRITLAPEME